MPQFLIDHLDGCTPFEPCASCQAVALLVAKLKPQDFKQFMKHAKAAGVSSVTITHFGLAKPAEKIDLNQKLDDVLELSNRIRFALRNYNVITLADLVSRTDEEMRRTPNIGKISLQELKHELDRHGLYLGMRLTETNTTEENPVER